MSRRALLASALLSLLLFNGGCAVIIWGVGWGVDASEIKEGSTRAAVEAKLGKPIRSERTREGGRIDTYEYTKPSRPESTNQAGEAFAADLVLFGVPEIIATPVAIYQRLTAPQARARVYFDPTDHVLWVSPGGGPPSEPRPAIKSR